MSKIVEYRNASENAGIPSWLWIIGLITGIGFAAYLIYQYFIYPGNVILEQYKKILEDIYLETKQFLEENEVNGIYGLTAEQEAILAAKEKAADNLRPEVERILNERNLNVAVWIETIIIGIIIVYAIKEVVPALIDKIRQWRSQNPAAAQSMASNYGHAHMIYELVANEYAYVGKLAIASPFYNVNIPSIYNNYTYNALNSQIAVYQALLPTLIPGTMQYLVAQNMLNYMTYEISATTGIMALLHLWFIIPL